MTSPSPSSSPLSRSLSLSSSSSSPSSLLLLLFQFSFSLGFFFFISETILENWQKINTEPVCFGARDDKYGAFNITKTGLLKTMKLVRKSGWIKCNAIDPISYWGCANVPVYGNNDLMTIITNVKKEAILPPAGNLKTLANGWCNNKKLFYSLNGTNHTSRELVFGDLTNMVWVSRNQELQIWYGQDWIDCAELDNSGATCVDVYVWYAYKETQIRC